MSFPDAQPILPPYPEPDIDELDVSVVIPCLNEERTIGRCIREAWEGIRASGLKGEVIVADNGSNDRSGERAILAGARIVKVSQRGYGAALQTGFIAAHGRLLIMGDADMSYDFRHIPRLIREQQLTQADIVVGNRFRGGIQPGAMPWTHRHIGNPLLSFMIRRFFGASLGDCYCGLRLITREAHRRLKMKATGMEYALEMIVQASLAGMKMAEAPTVLRVDGRDVPPHLKTVRDGYRSFRFLFQHGPITLYLWPGAALIGGGLGWMGLSIYRDLTHHYASSSFSVALAAACLLLGWLLILLGAVSRVFAAGYLNSRVDPFLLQFFARWRLEHGIVAAVVLFLFSIGAIVYGPDKSPSLAALGLSSFIISIGSFFGTFVISLMGRAIPDTRFYLNPNVQISTNKVSRYRAEMARSNPLTRQNEAHSLPTQHVLAQARRYNQWLMDWVDPVLKNVKSVLDVGCSIGNMTQILSDRMAIRNPESRVIGLEIIPEAVEEFRRRVGESERLRVIHGDILSPPKELTELAPFDAAVCFNVLEHIDDDILALQKIGGLLTPGGKLGLVVPGGGETLYGTLDALDRHFRRYTPYRLASRLKEAGYTIERIHYSNFAGYFLWFFKGRIVKARKFNEGDVKNLDRCIPILRILDAVTGPPVGQSVVAIARWNPRSESRTPPSPSPKKAKRNRRK